MIVFVAMLVGCGNGKDTSDVDFEFHTFRNEGVGEAREITRLMNLSELNYYLYEHDINDGEFYEFLTEHYTADFFALNYIVFITLPGGGADSFVVASVKSNGNIHISQKIGILANVESWKVVIELPITFAPATFQIELNEV